MTVRAESEITLARVDDGASGSAIWTTSTAPSTPNYTFTISNLSGPSGTPSVGDLIVYSYYRYTITSVSSSTVLAGSRVSIRGSAGASSKWYTGNKITGTSTTATIFSGSGISSAVVGDMYLNTDTGNTYRCTTAGNASTAKWVYENNIKGDDGVTFTPNVDANGDISWTNDGGLPNPATQNIMGPSGLSISSVKTQYYLSTDSASATGGSWEDEPQEFVSGKFYWTRDYITYSDGTNGTSTPVYNQGLTLANEYALSANDAAQSATNFAVYAREQLSVVEDIVGVLDLLAQNGEYIATTDKAPIPDKRYFKRTGSGTAADPYVYTLVTDGYEYVLTSDVAIDPDKTYYTRSGSGTSLDPYVYTEVESPDVSDIGTYYELENPASLGYYELVGIDASIQNYVSSHLVLDTQGLNLMNGKTRLLLSTADGLVLFDQDGGRIAQYGSETFIGNGNYKVRLTPTGMIFVDNNVPVASVSQQELVINNTRVNNSMRMGNFVWTINTDGRLILKYSAEA